MSCIQPHVGLVSPRHLRRGSTSQVWAGVGQVWGGLVKEWSVTAKFGTVLIKFGLGSTTCWLCSTKLSCEAFAPPRRSPSPVPRSSRWGGGCKVGCRRAHTPPARLRRWATTQAPSRPWRASAPLDQPWGGGGALGWGGALGEVGAPLGRSPPFPPGPPLAAAESWRMARAVLEHKAVGASGWRPITRSGRSRCCRRWRPSMGLSSGRAGGHKRGRLHLVALLLKRGTAD